MVGLTIRQGILGGIAIVVVFIVLIQATPIKDLVYSVIDYNPVGNITYKDGDLAMEERELESKQKKILDKFVKGYKACKDSPDSNCLCRSLHINLPRGQLIVLANTGGATTVNVVKGKIIPGETQNDFFEREYEQVEITVRELIPNDEIYVAKYGDDERSGILSKGFLPGRNYQKETELTLGTGYGTTVYTTQQVEGTLGTNRYRYDGVYKVDATRMAFSTNPRFGPSADQETFELCDIRREEEPPVALGQQVNRITESRGDSSSCFDSDSGSIYTKGTITITSIETGIATGLIDGCLSETSLLEQSCNNDGTHKQEAVDCASENKICSEGACVDRPQTS